MNACGPPRIARAIAVVLLALGSSACSLLGAIGDAQRFQTAIVLVGTVRVAPIDEHVPVIVAAIDVHTGAVEHAARLHEPGGYELLVPRSQYRVVAFVDRNDNGTLDDTESAGASDVTIAAPPGRVLVNGVDVTIAGSSAIDRDDMKRLQRVPRFGSSSTQAGAPADLDAPKFSADAGRSGYWEPWSSFRRYGASVYFLEPYDARRTPILFVHGAAGSPQDWRAMIDALDTTRYQAWVFHYPSGAALEITGDVLNWKLANLRQRHGFSELHIVAHSMGGLVVRSFLTRHGGHFPELRTFVSLSTPWSGVGSAALGVRMSPVVVPSWMDLQPGGPFLQQLLGRPLPASVEHHLYFGHKAAGWVRVRSNDDGAVTLASQLDRRAQQQAHVVLGFDENHVSILRSPAAIQEVQKAVQGAPVDKMSSSGYQVTNGKTQAHAGAAAVVGAARGSRRRVGRDVRAVLRGRGARPAGSEARDSRHPQQHFRPLGR